MAKSRRRTGGRTTRRRRGGKRRMRGGKRRRRGGKSATRKRRGGFFYKKCATNFQCNTAKGEICDHGYKPFGVRYGFGDGTCRSQQGGSKCTIM